MNEFETTTSERIKVENIQKKYFTRQDNKFQQLKKIDEKVHSPGRILAVILGIIGSLTMGAGMSFVMVWENMSTGLLLGIPGLIIALSAYPIYKALINSRRKKFAEEIISRSNDLINN